MECSVGKSRNEVAALWWESEINPDTDAVTGAMRAVGDATVSL